MKCQDYQNQIIQSNDNGLSESDQNDLNSHLADCSVCRQFESDFLEIRTAIQSTKSVFVPEELDEQTRTLCITQLNRTKSAQQSDPIRQWIPVIASGVIFLTISITGFAWMQGLHEQYPLLERLGQGMLVQNLLMLLLSPALLRMKFHQWRLITNSSHPRTSGQFFGLIF
jgi:hypothetical protein